MRRMTGSIYIEFTSIPRKNLVQFSTAACRHVALLGHRLGSPHPKVRMGHRLVDVLAPMQRTIPRSGPAQLCLLPISVPPRTFLAKPTSQMVGACGVEPVSGYRREHRQPLQQRKSGWNDRATALPHLVCPSASGSIRASSPGVQE
jgi:hypothetical protein